MKHSKNIIAILIILFLAAQYTGLFIVNSYSTQETQIIEGKEVVKTTWEPLPYNIERPHFKEETSYLPMLILILITTFLVMLVLKFRAEWLWKAWFFLAVVFCLTIAFNSFMKETLAFALAIVLTIFKVFKRNPITHNISEIFIYGGLVAVFAPIMNISSIIILLLLISAYDFIAVFKTKHMISMAKFQARMKLFAGLLIPYKKNKIAVLGGGDIGIPLLFAAIVMKTNFLGALIIPIFAALALLYLMISGDKNKFYPAMPYLTIGCLIGYLISIFI